MIIIRIFFENTFNFEGPELNFFIRLSMNDMQKKKIKHKFINRTRFEIIQIFLN